MSRRIKLKNANLHARQLEGETVAVDTDTSNYLSFNSTATLLWPMLAVGTTRERLVERIVTEYEVDAARAQADVDAFIATLEREALLES